MRSFCERYYTISGFFNLSNRHRLFIKVYSKVAQQTTEYLIIVG